MGVGLLLLDCRAAMTQHHTSVSIMDDAWGSTQRIVHFLTQQDAYLPSRRLAQVALWALPHVFLPLTALAVEGLQFALQAET